MITFDLDGAEDLAEAFYLALMTIDQFDGKLGTKLWRNVKGKERERFMRAAERLIVLYQGEGLSARSG